MPPVDFGVEEEHTACDRPFKIKYPFLYSFVLRLRFTIIGDMRLTHNIVSHRYYMISVLEALINSTQTLVGDKREYVNSYKTVINSYIMLSTYCNVT